MVTSCVVTEKSPKADLRQVLSGGWLHACHTRQRLPYRSQCPRPALFCHEPRLSACCVVALAALEVTLRRYLLGECSRMTLATCTLAQVVLATPRMCRERMQTKFARAGCALSALVPLMLHASHLGFRHAAHFASVNSANICMQAPRSPTSLLLTRRDCLSALQAAVAFRRTKKPAQHQVHVLPHRWMQVLCPIKRG